MSEIHIKMLLRFFCFRFLYISNEPVKRKGKQNFSYLFFIFRRTLFKVNGKLRREDKEEQRENAKE